MKRFALIGAAGYIAPRHMRAIKDTGNTLVAALDPNDSVGIIDSHFPDAAFFTEFERFDRYVNKLSREGRPIHYVSICSPNYLHDAHIRFGLRNNADVICEKPLVLNPWNVEGLREIEQETGRRVYTILQLRLHPALQALKQYVEASPKDKVFDVELTYLTSRGRWYYASWKGNVEKSGGIATNIGIHFFDMLHWIFGEVLESRVYIHTHDRACGFLRLEKARVNWFLSINYDVLAQGLQPNNGQRTFRSITVEGREVEFSEGFTDLHTLSYQKILQGEGFSLNEAAQAVELTYQIRNAKPVELNGEHYHPLAKLPLVPHPFERE